MTTQMNVRSRGDQPTGPAVAAMIAVLLGIVALVFADQMANHSKAVNDWVYSVGKWMPGSTGSGPGGSIGPYSGKETIAVVVWLVSWAVLQGFMRNSSPSMAKSIKWFLIALVLICINFIDPLADFTFGWMKLL